MSMVCQRLYARAGLRPLPFRSAQRLTSVRVHAKASPIPVPVWPKDTETTRDLFAFAGSAPERVNGRVAMIGFVSILGPEISKQQPLIEQIGDNWLFIILFATTITFASILPKIISGISLKELHATATGANMKGEGLQQALAYFDADTELWSGRLAMLGFAGLLAIELIKGEALF